VHNYTEISQESRNSSSVCIRIWMDNIDLIHTSSELNYKIAEDECNHSTNSVEMHFLYFSSISVVQLVQEIVMTLSSDELVIKINIAITFYQNKVASWNTRSQFIPVFK